MTIKDNQQLRDSLRCPACGGVKQKGLVVCWYCWRNTPKPSNIDCGGYKDYTGTLHEFINEVNVPF